MLLTSCSDAVTTPAPSPSVTASTSASPGDLGAVRATLDGLADAVRRDDEPAFRALTSTIDPSFRDRARVLYANLTALRATELTFRPAAETRELTGTRRNVFAGRAWVQAVTVEWRLPGETAPADHRLPLTFVAEPAGVRLAGTIDGVDRDEQQPIWSFGPVTATRNGSVTVLTGAGQSPQRWSPIVAQAVAGIDRALPARLKSGWDGAVVAEVPATESDFEHILGVPTGSRRGIAAVTQIEGSSDTAAIRVVVNPRITESVDGNDLTRVLAHEVVHVATASPRSAAPAWVVEGLAEWASLRHQRDGRSWATSRLLDQVRRSGAPNRLPRDADFAVDGDRQRLAYAEAWLACRHIADTYAVDRLGAFYAALDRGDPLTEASRATLGVSAETLVAGWRRDLVRLARH